MASLLKAAVKEATKIGSEVQKHASELQQNASLLAQDLSQRIDASPGCGRRDHVFEDGPLGFALDSALAVASMDQDGQAAKLGVGIGCRLVAVDGYDVPAAARGVDPDQEQQRIKLLVERWLDDMARPGTLAFVHPDSEAMEKSTLQGWKEWLLEDVPVPMEKQILKKIDDSIALVAVTGEGAAEGASEDLAAATGSQASPAAEASGRTPGAAPAGVEQFDIWSEGDPSGDEDFAGGAEEEALEAARSEPHPDAGELAAGADAAGADPAADAGAVAELLERARADLKAERQQVAKLRSRNEAARKRVADLQEQLAAASSQCEDLRFVVAQSEAAIRRASEERQTALEEEIKQLRGSLSAAELQNRAITESAEQMVAAAEMRISDMEIASVGRVHEVKDLAARAAAAEEQAGTLGQELSRLRESHEEEIGTLRTGLEAEIEKLREARDLSVQYEQQAANELRAVKQELAEARKTATDAAEERRRLWASSGNEEQDEQADNDDASSERLEEGVREATPGGHPPRGEDTGGAAAKDTEVVALYDRIDFLERRCASLSKKLNARPIMFQPTDSGHVAGGGAISWEPYLRTTLGPRASNLVVRLYGTPERALRGFTQRLLKYDAWLWLFYFYILVLHGISASCYAQAEAKANPANTVDAFNMRVQQGMAPVASSGGAAAAALVSATIAPARGGHA